MIKELEQSYRMNKKVIGIEFKPIEADERPCNHDTSRFVIFYVDIIARLRIGLPFNHFQVDVMCSIRVCLSQLTRNAWAFIICFEVACLHLELEPSADAFLFFFTHA